jgi:1-acyl-sn-glycerol-3-phosphate acyltransferase
VVEARDPTALTATLASLANDEVIVIFAEGRVSHTEAALAPFARGVGYLALASGASVVPVWLAGTAELYLGRPLAVTVGEPRSVARCAPAKQRTLEVARTVHDDLARVARPWSEPAIAHKRWRWLTNLF